MEPSKGSLDNPSPFLNMKPFSLVTHNIYFNGLKNPLPLVVVVLSPIYTRSGEFNTVFRIISATFKPAPGFLKRK